MTFERGVNACDLTEANPVQLHVRAWRKRSCPRLASLQSWAAIFFRKRTFQRPEVALISDGLWLSRYNRDPRVLNRTIDLDDHPVRILGVLPKDFEMPRLQPQTLFFQRPWMWPCSIQSTPVSVIRCGHLRASNPVSALPRPGPKWSTLSAHAAVDSCAISRGIQAADRSIRDRQMQDAYTAAWVLLGAVFAVLLISCANVASLFSARGAARQRELAVRSALAPAVAGSSVKLSQRHSFCLWLVLPLDASWRNFCCASSSRSRHWRSLSGCGPARLAHRAFHGACLNCLRGSLRNHARA